MNKEKNLYLVIDLWAKPILEELGEAEWRKGEFVISSPDLVESGEEAGWVVRKIASNSHYLVDIKRARVDGESDCFVVKTGGEAVFSGRLDPKSLKEAIVRALEQGPTHLPPSRVQAQRKR